MATKPSNIASIEAATGRTWSDWVTALNQIGAQAMEHKEIAEIVRKELEGTVDSSGWWAQGVAVAYEQEIGRRKPGQNNDGSFETSVTKTVIGSKEDVLALWVEAHGEAREFNGELVDNVRTSVTPVRCYWRCNLSDGSLLSIATEQKSPDKAMITATHSKLASEDAKDEWRQYWKELISRL